MGFFKKPWKAIKGTINKIPGGQHLTGRAKSRQKLLYNEASSNYENYANEAKSNIEALAKQLEDSKKSLQSLESAKYQHQHKGRQLQGELGNYANSLQGLEKGKAKLESEANNLQSAFSVFDKVKVEFL